jgi:hypothetical protein
MIALDRLRSQHRSTYFLFAGKVKGGEAPVACNFGFTEPGTRPLATR